MKHEPQLIDYENVKPSGFNLVALIDETWRIPDFRVSVFLRARDWKTIQVQSTMTRSDLSLSRPCSIRAQGRECHRGFPHQHTECTQQQRRHNSPYRGIHTSRFNYPVEIHSTLQTRRAYRLSVTSRFCNHFRAQNAVSRWNQLTIYKRNVVKP